jgi:hypothetical protein
MSLARAKSTLLAVAKLTTLGSAAIAAFARRPGGRQQREALGGILRRELGGRRPPCARPR